jgi:hypothetical protein
MKYTTEIIEKYLLNQLSEAEKKNFEEELAKNQELKKQVEAQKEIMKGLEQYAMKQQVSRGIKQAKMSKLIRKAIALTLTVAVLATGAWYVKKKISTLSEHLKYELNEQGNNQWSDADKHLPSQFFTIDPKKDTILETEQGIIFQVKAGTFLNKFGEVPHGPIEFEVKEAMIAADIIKGGLSTTSNGKLLETGGMFYVNARDGKEVLDIDKSKPINVHVPNSGEKKMSLFDGERSESGNINWIDPKPMKKFLSTVDIMSLNFYPPHFLDTLASMGYDVKNKILTDSIYYSFYCGQKQHVVSDSSRLEMKKDSVRDFSSNLLIDPIVELDAGGKPVMTGVVMYDGEQLFKQNCATCHDAFTDKRISGPGLLGVTDRVPKGDWLMRYILNNERMIKNGDAYANEIYEKFNKQAMNVFEGQLNKKQVQAIINYLGGSSPFNYGEYPPTACGIEPSMIHAIWDKKFNNTILATKAFEERLQVIFSTCNPGIFDLYVKNLDRDLCELDEAAAGMAGDRKDKFIEFAKRKDGGIRVSDKEQKRLQDYFRRKQKIYDQAVKAAKEKLYKEENTKAEAAQNKRNEHDEERFEKTEKILMEEINKNLDEAYRQLGYKEIKTRIKVVNSPVYLSAEITSPGWKNVDQYVMESTIARTTLDYTDPKTGKKAVIEYKEASVEIPERAKYDRILCYLLPQKLSSFQLMKDKGNIFAENLNMTFKYSLILVAYKGEQAYYWEQPDLQPQKYTAAMKEIDAGALMGRINSRYHFAGTADIVKDIDHQLFEQKEMVRMDKIKKREEITSRLQKIVFPCYSSPQAIYSEDVLDR